MTIEQSIGRVAKEARTSRDLSHQAMAKRIGCAPSTVGTFESGIITWATLCDFAQALRISVGGLVSLAEEMKPQFEAQEHSRTRMLERMAG